MADLKIQYNIPIDILAYTKTKKKIVMSATTKQTSQV